MKEMGKQKMDLVTKISPTAVEKNADGTLTLKTDKGNFVLSTRSCSLRVARR